MPTKTRPPLLDEASYPILDTEYEEYDERVQLRHVREGDTLHVGEINFKVNIKKTGTKWTEVFEAGHRILRDLNESLVTVTRRRQTKASRAADRRVDSNRAILRNLEEDLDRPDDDDAYWVRKVGEELDEMKTRVNKGWLLGSDYIGSLMLAQSRAKVRGEWLQAVEWAASGKKHVDRYKDDSPLWEGDLVDVLEEFIDHLNEKLVSMQSSFPLSRSSSVIENVMTDVDVWVVAEFIKDAKWWRL